MAVAIQQTDPTRTTTARRRFAQHLRDRFNAIKWHINRGLINNDAFGLNPAGGISLAANVDTDPEITPGYREWADLRDAEATARFDDWLDGAMEREILEKYEGDTYIRQGYVKGLKNADLELRRADIAESELENIQRLVRQPIHRDKLERIYTRTFQALDGVTEATANEMRRELTDGLAEGENPRVIARSLNDRAEAVGKTRATVLARTEVIRAHSESTLTRYEEIAGDIPVTVKAEWLTAGDDRVCDECAALEGNEYSIEEARGMLPLHPQCRCSWVPNQS